MKSPTPITPEERGRTDDEGMQQNAHLARLGGGAAIPLTPVTQGAGTTTVLSELRAQKLIREKRRLRYHYFTLEG
jgi:hypothetical protein